MSPESTRVPSTHLQRTLPEAPSAPRVQRMTFTPEAPECDACPEYPSRGSSSGYRRACHLSPSAEAESQPQMRHVSPAERPLPRTSRVRRARETPHLETLPGTLR